MSEPWPRSTCRSCAAPIIWTVTVHDKEMPVDYEPDVAGNLVLLLIEGSRIRALWKPGSAMPKHRSHFATCPHRKHWRKRK